ncbi:efflux transporter, outer membrane factor (OMF) lipoprotein, NodT family [Methylomagnum ishizawai]|uniref:Efflux transporter, outer membrane factor (OMF) lipoprotein, NodT family n=1 Tax=Methylomagnum ishizawai TaxID=1760988 RepID=A0A1Y6DAF9_9GAMM|nr:efflux transporter outer membrane subunit [Methylomagnum ishizawai]SMF97322.1 efflux transporter, outer membrane factor (OMF) lipoprotein, NodT family [Methylomagnum ishizawai]
MSCAALIQGCTLGPDFRRPELSTAASYTGVRPVTPPSQRIRVGRDIPAEWWTLFRSHELKGLIERAFINNPDLASAQASLAQVRENLASQQSGTLPSFQASAMSRYQSIASGMFGNPNGPDYRFAIYDISASVSYTVDLFGKVRRQIEDQTAQEEYQRFQLEAAYLTLAGNIVANAVQEASLRGQLASLEELAELQRQGLDILRQQAQLGAVAESAVLSQASAFNESQANLIALRQQLAQSRHQLAVLTGRFPGEPLPEEFTLDDLQAPTELPLSVPLKLVEQRPDVRSAEAAAHSASAQVGVATAKMFPDISLKADLGSFATQASQLLMPGSGIWGVGLNLAQPLFEWGKNTHAQQAAIAGFQQAAAKYRSSVLQAFQDVANTLKNLEADHQTLEVQASSVQIAQENLTLAQAQSETGGLSYLALLDSQRNYKQAQLGWIKARATLLGDSAALFQALGGGWWNRTPPHHSPHRQNGELTMPDSVHSRGGARP